MTTHARYLPRRTACAAWLLLLLGGYSVTAIASQSSFLEWPEGFPRAAVTGFQPGVTTREQVLAALGKPLETLAAPRNKLRYRVKAACLPDYRQRIAENVLHYQDRMRFPVKLYGKKHKMQQDVHVYFDANGRYCAATVLRTLLEQEEFSFPDRYYLKILSNVGANDPKQSMLLRPDWDEYTWGE